MDKGFLFARVDGDRGGNADVATWGCDEATLCLYDWDSEIAYAAL